MAAVVLAVLLTTLGCTDDPTAGQGAEPVASETATGPSEDADESPADTDRPTVDGDDIGARYDIPDEARATSGGADPRGPEFWLLWNSCAPENRAEEAAANGGRAAGFVLVDDILEDPGIQLGEHLLTSCEEAVALLGPQPSDGDGALSLARQLLTAELNLNVGAETCPIAEEAAVGGQLILAAAGFDGTSTGPLDDDAAGALPQVTDLLTSYNSGDLCR